MFAEPEPDPFLPGEAHARADGHETSKHAAERIRGGPASEREFAVLVGVAVLEALNVSPVTQNETVAELGVQARRDSYKPRFRPLVRKRFLADAGKRRSPHDSQECRAFELTARGRDLLRRSFDPDTWDRATHAPALSIDALHRTRRYLDRSGS